MINLYRMLADPVALKEGDRQVSQPQRMLLVSVAILIFCLAFIGSAARSDAQTETVINSFNCTSGQEQIGCIPTGGVIARNGVLYGTTVAGGAPVGDGIVYALKPPSTTGGVWSELVLYQFLGGDDGANPAGVLLGGANRILYGVTQGGGTSGEGTIFSLQPPTNNGTPWVKNLLYSFAGGSDAALPGYGLVADATGTLYGATGAGGLQNCVGGCGAVFSLTPPAASGGAWTENVIYSFTGASDGANPSGPLLRGSDGTLYSTVSFGGANGSGAVYALTPPSTAGGAWTESVLYSFTDQHDGAFPGGALTSVNGRLYGTSNFGTLGDLGQVFVLIPPAVAGGVWTERTIWSFGLVSGFGAADNQGVIAHNGALFGTTAGGGTDSAGTVFQLTPPASSTAPWTGTIVYSFTNPGGLSRPSGLTVGPGGALYGTREDGGTFNGGIVYSVTP